MRKKIAIIRLGVAQPLPKEIPIIMEISEGAEKCAFGGSCGAGVLSLVYTTYSPSEIAEKFKQLADATDDTLPVIVFELGSPNVCFDFSKMAIDPMIAAFEDMCAEMDGAPASQAKVTIELSLDQLLDLATSRGGIDKLSAEELKRLEKLSKDL